MASIKKNFIYNLILTFSSQLISLAVFPYVARTLGVGLMGRVGFADNVVSYFSIFSTLGITVLGVREIAFCGDDYEKRSKAFSSLIALLLINTLLVFAVYISSIFLIPRFSQEKDLLFVGAFSLFFSSMMIEWFYQGIENFKYIAIRTLTVRVLYAVLVFILIRTESDYIIYYALTVLAAVSNALINFIHSRNFVSFKFRYVDIFRYSKSFYFLGLYVLMVSMYTTFNVVYLGFVCPDEAVGNYYVSIKIFYICTGVLNAFTTVMMPRMSNLASHDRMDEFNENIIKSFRLLSSFAIPLIIGTVVLSRPVIELLSGDGYEGAIVPMRIIMPVLLITGMAQIWVIQVLMPLNKDRIILIGAVVGAICGVAFNLILTDKLAATGSAIVLFISELAGNSVTLAYALRNKLFKFPGRQLLHGLVENVPCAIICFASLYLFKHSLTIVLVSVILCGTYFLILNRKRFSFK